MHAQNRMLAALVVTFWGCLVASDHPAAQTPTAQTWPQRAVRVIVPLPPGIGFEVSGRIFAEHLSARWKQPVLIENIAGADGILAAKEFVGRHDDHTLLYSFAGLITINPLLYEKLPYDPSRDLVPIATTSDNFLVVATSVKLHIGSLDGLARLARAPAAKLSWAATAGIPYFAVSSFLKNAGIGMVYVPYRDFNPALSDLGEGRIELASTALAQLLPQSQAGRVTMLAVLNRTRSPLAPDVPTTVEAGFPNLTFDAVSGFFGWRDMPGELRDRIAADVHAVADIAAVRDRLPSIGAIARVSGPDEFAAMIEAQRAKVAAIAASVGAKPPQ